MQRVAIWVSESVSSTLVENLFVYNKSTGDIDASFFKKLFKIKKSEFFDEEHIYIIYEELENISNIENIKGVIEKYGFLEIWSGLEKECKKNNITKIDYMVIAPDFEYSGKVLEVENIKFIGNFLYELEDGFLDWIFKDQG